MSPYGTFVVLSMLANGDEGESRDKILQTFDVSNSDDNIHVLNSLNFKLLCELPALDNSVKLSINNSFWHNPMIGINGEFMSNMKSSYLCEE